MAITKNHKKVDKFDVLSKTNIKQKVNFKYHFKNPVNDKKAETNKILLAQIGNGEETKVSERKIAHLHNRAIKCFYGSMRQNKLIKIIKESIKQHNMSLEDKITWGFETLLSSVLYRSKISPTYHHAKQQISHKHILVNNKLVNIWSYRLKVGDEITLLPKARDNKIILDSLKNNRKIPEYLDCANPFVIKMINNPTAASVTHGFNINYPLLIRNI